MVVSPEPPGICYVSCQPMPCFMQMMPCPAPAPQPPPCPPARHHRPPCPPPQHHRLPPCPPPQHHQPPPCPPPQHHQPPPCPPPQHHQPPPCPPPPCCRPCPPPDHGSRPSQRPACICYPASPAASLPSNANKESKCPTCCHGGARETYDRIERKDRPSNYGTPGALSNPGAGCQGPPCLGRSVCPPPCQPQFTPMLPCCTGKCPPGPCPVPGTSLLVGKPPEAKCQPCCGKPPGCSPVSEFPFNNPGPCEPCLWPPMCLGS